MRVSLDGAEIDVPGATTLSELLDGVGPQIDPSRLVTELVVDGRDADATDPPALAAWRLAGGETVRIGTESPEDFARTRRAEIAGHLTRIADLFEMVAHGFETGLIVDANRVLAEAAHELRLVLELDQQVARLAGAEPECQPIAAIVDRIGTRLTDAQRGERWAELAQLLNQELVPPLRAG